MKRGDVYLVSRPAGDPKVRRPVVIVARQALLDLAHSTVVCAPVYTNGRDLATEVRVGEADGLKAPSFVHCDDLRGIDRVRLTNFVGQLSAEKILELDYALAVAVGIDHLLA